MKEIAQLFILLLSLMQKKKTTYKFSPSKRGSRDINRARDERELAEYYIRRV